jgi:hypothetical protein
MKGVSHPGEDPLANLGLRNVLVATLALGALLVVSASSCSSKSAAGIESSCAINTDCNSPLICAFAKCHNACRESRDCSTGERCVLTGTAGTCQLPAESTCSGAAATCQSGEVCGGDQQCRQQCSAAIPCPQGDFCLPSGATSACFTPSNATDVLALVSAGIVSLDGSVLSDGSAATGDGSGPAMSSNDGPSSEASSSNDAGGSGPDGTSAPDVAVNRCPSPQTQFGFPAQGDVNMHFVSGVGVRTAKSLLIFDGFSGPDPQSDAGTLVGLVYAQAFDPATGNSLGPAMPLFDVPGTTPNTAVTLVDVSIAPTGEIALLYKNYTSTVAPALWATFLSQTGGDGGVAGVQVQRTVQVESVTTSNEHAIWSVASQSFVFSWMYNDGAQKLKVRKFFPTGASAGSDTNTVPASFYSGYVQAGVATSGDLLAVGWTMNPGGYPHTPYLTLLDPTGNQFGGYVKITSDAGDADNFFSVGGTAAGFVSICADGATVHEFFSPVSGDAGVVGGPGDPSLDGGAFAGFSFASTAVDSRTISEDPSGAGGVGVGLLEKTGVSFLYIGADGVSHVGPTTVFSHAYGGTDQIAVTSTGGSFGVSLFDSAGHSTMMAASGCH